MRPIGYSIRWEVIVEKVWPEGVAMSLSDAEKGRGATPKEALEDLQRKLRQDSDDLRSLRTMVQELEA